VEFELSACSYPEAFISALNTLQRHDLLTDDVIRASIVDNEPVASAESSSHVKTPRLLNDDTCRKLQFFGYFLIVFYGSFERYSFLRPYYNDLLARDDIMDFSYILTVLIQYHDDKQPGLLTLLTKNNCDRLFSFTARWLRSQEAIETVWDRLITYPLTQEVIDELISIAGRDNPAPLAQRFVDHLLNTGAPELQSALSPDQSTHTASVYRSASESAEKLANRYMETLQEQGSITVIEQIKSYINQLPDDGFRNSFAKRSLERITGIDYNFTDSGSWISIHQLLGLCWLGLNDETICTAPREDRLRRFVVAISNCQHDLTICNLHAFNKIISALDKIHPDVEIIYINKDFADLDLQAVVKREALNYLNHLAESSTVNEYHEFRQLLKDIEKSGFSVIWESIKLSVEDSIIANYGSELPEYKSEHQDFVKKIAVISVETDDLSKLLIKAEASPGGRALLQPALCSHSAFASSGSGSSRYVSASCMMSEDDEMLDSGLQKNPGG
tara:strand:- start:8417 stop:9922 length:1506 start_codon:yes stop_codon:yes gene_type:complete